MPVTCVFGTLSVRPSVEGYEHLRYFRYPNGEEHVYDIVADPGETTNLADKNPPVVSRLLAQLRAFRNLKIENIPGFRDGCEGFVAPKDWKIPD